MNYAEAKAAINKRWLQLWPTRSGNVPFTTDNNEKPEAATFARLSIISADSDQSTLASRDSGAQKILRTGFIDVRLTGPNQVGSGPLDLLCVVVAGIFETRRFALKRNDDGIITHASSVSELRRDPDSPQLWIVSVITPFEYTERP